MTEKFQHPDAIDQLLEALFAVPAQRWVLPNGLVIVCVPDHALPLVSCQVWVRTGSLHEGPQTGAGLSHFLEHMVFKGTSRRASGGIAADVTDLGASINAYTSFDRTVYHIDGNAEHCGQMLEILEDLVFQPSLKTEDFETEREVILREISMTEDDPDRRLSQALFANAFRSHPYGVPVIGHKELFEAVRLEDLRAYHEGRYTPNNCVLIVAGDVTEVELRQMAGERFASIRRRPLVERLLPDEAPQLSCREERLTADVRLGRGAMAFKIPSINHPDAPGLDILASVLGGGESSLLYRELRDRRKLVNTIGASVWNPGSQGLFWISYQCEPGNCPEVEEAVKGLIQQTVSEGVTQEELDKALNQALASEINARKSVSGQASRVGLAEVVVGDLGYPQHYFQSIRRLNPGDLAPIATRYLHSGGLTQVTLTPPGDAAHSRPTRLGRGRSLPDFVEERLPNGARLLFQPDRRLPKIHLRSLHLGGPLYESPETAGLSALMATLLVRDTRHRHAAEIAHKIERCGGYFQDFSGNNAFGVSLEILPRDLDLGLSLLEDALTVPRFKEEPFKVERDAQIAHYKEDEDEILERGRRFLRREFFGSHPFSWDACGYPDALTRLHTGLAAAQFRRLVVASNTVLSVCGDFDPDELVPRLTFLLRALPDYAFFPRSLPLTQPARVGELELKMPREQAIILAAYPAPAITDTAFLAGEVLDDLLSDMSSTLFRKVREEQGLAYFVGAARLSGISCGMFYFYGGTAPETAPRVHQAFSDEAARLRESGPSPEEIEQARRRLKTHKRMSLQGIGARATIAGLNALYGLPVNDWRDYDARLDAIDVEVLQNFARTYLNSQSALSLTVGP